MRRSGRREEERGEGAVIASKNKNPTLRMWGIRRKPGESLIGKKRESRESKNPGRESLMGIARLSPRKPPEKA